nr:hypothetical protein [Tanacetum cinerariifolium]
MMTNKDSSAAGTDNRPPMLEENDYESWRIHIEWNIKGKPHGKLIWKSIQNGPTPHPQTTDPAPKGGAVPLPRNKRDKEFTEEDNKNELADIQSINILSQGLSRTLFDEFERFHANGNELIQDYLVRFHKLVNDMKVTQLDIPTHQLNTKFANNLPSYWGKTASSNTRTKGIQTTGSGVNNSGKKVICYNCHGEGHVARQCKEPKHARDSQWYHDKALLMQAKEKGAVLDAEAEAFLADVECTAPYDQPLVLTTTNLFEANHEDAYDSDVDEGPHASAAFMANLSSTCGTNGSSSNHINEVQISNDSVFSDVSYPLAQEMQQEEHINSEVDSVLDENMITYDEYQNDSGVEAVPTVVSADEADKQSMIAVLQRMHTEIAGYVRVNDEHKLVNASLTAKLERCKIKMQALERNKVKHDLDMAIVERNKRNAELEEENVMLKSTLKSKVVSIEKLITRIKIDGTSTLTIPGPVTTEEKAQKKNDVKHRSVLLMDLPNEHLLTFSQYKDAKTLFEAIQVRFGGNDATKKTQRTLLKQMYKNFNAPSIESLDFIFNRLQKIVSQLAILDLDTMSIDDLYNNFKIVEQEVKRTVFSSLGSPNMALLSSPGSTNEVDTASIQVSAISTPVSTVSSHDNTANLSDATVYAFLANQPNGSQLVHEDLEQIYEDDLKEMDLKWQLPLLSMRVRRSSRNQKSRPRNQDSLRKTVIVKDTSSKAMVAIDVAGFDWSYIADDEVPTNMALMDFSDSERLDKLIGSQITDNSKTGLGFTSYNAIAPPPIGLFAPLSINLSNSGLEEFQHPEFKGYRPNDSKSVCIGTSIEIKKALDAPIIEDWVSDSDEDESKEMMVQKPVLKNVEKGTVQKEVRSVWNNEMRTNHQNFSKSRRNFAPTTFLTKSGIVPISTARQSSSRAATPISADRPINTAASKPIVNVAKLRQNALQTTRSVSSRPFYQQTTIKNKYLNNNVNVAKANSVNTTKGNKVTSAVGNQGTNEHDRGYVSFEGGAIGGKITGKGTLRTTTKDESSRILKSFITKIENLVEKKVKIIRCDKETKFKNRVMNEFCEEKGIKREYSVARTPQ